MAGLKVAVAGMVGRRRPVVRAVVAALVALVLAVVIGVSAAQAAPVLTVTRHAGTDRYATASAIATASYPQGTSTVLLASGTSFPDALAASTLAGVMGAPVLLSGPGQAPRATEEAVRALAPQQVIAVGGTARIDDQTLSQVAAAAGGAATRRIAGADRYATAALVAAAVPDAQLGQVAGMRTAVVATGENFPDALAAAPITASAHLPLLLAGPGSLSQQAVQVMGQAGITQVLIMGGTASVNTAIEQQITATGISTVRLGGAERGATAATIADWAMTTLGFTASSVALARGDDAGGGVDALAIGPLAAQRREAVLLTASPTSPGGATAAWVAAHATTLDSLDVAGGTSAVDGQVISALEATVVATRAASVPPAPSDPIPTPSTPPPSSEPSAPPVTSPPPPPDPGPGPAPAPVTPTPPQQGAGQLQVTVAGLPEGTQGAVAVSGPGGYYQQVASTQILSGLRAGIYQISAAPVPVPAEATTAYPDENTPASVEVAAGARASVQVAYSNHVAETTRVVAPSAALSLTGAPEDPERTLMLDPTRTPALAVGQVLVMGVSDAAPHGVLGRVAMVREVDGATQVTLIPASLRDALPYADLHLSTTTDTAAAQPTPQPSVDAQVFAGPLPSAPAETSAQRVLPSDARAARMVATEAREVDIGISGGASLPCGLVSQPAITLTPAIEPVIVLNLKWTPLLQPEVEFGGGFKGTFDTDLTVDVGPQCTASVYLPLITAFAWTFVPFPIVVEGNVGLDLSLSGGVTKPVGVNIHTDIDTVTTAFWRDNRWEAGKAPQEMTTTVTPTGMPTFRDPPNQTLVFNAAAALKTQILLYGAVGGDLALQIKDTFTLQHDDPVWAIDRTTSFRGGIVATAWGLLTVTASVDLIPPATERIAQAASSTGATPQPGPPPDEDRPFPYPCDGIAQCQVVDRVDVNGDGLPETLTMTKKGDTKSFVLGVHGPGVDHDQDLVFDWYKPGIPYRGAPRGLYFGAAELDGSPGKEIVVLRGRASDAEGWDGPSPHSDVYIYRAFAWRDGRWADLFVPVTVSNGLYLQGVECKPGGILKIYKANVNRNNSGEEIGAYKSTYSLEMIDGRWKEVPGEENGANIQQITRQEFDDLGPEWKGWTCDGLPNISLLL